MLSPEADFESVGTPNTCALGDSQYINIYPLEKGEVQYVAILYWVRRRSVPQFVRLIALISKTLRLAPLEISQTMSDSAYFHSAPLMSFADVHWILYDSAHLLQLRPVVVLSFQFHNSVSFRFMSLNPLFRWFPVSSVKCHLIPITSWKYCFVAVSAFQVRLIQLASPSSLRAMLSLGTRSSICHWHLAQCVWHTIWSAAIRTPTSNTPN